jgi:hypothetical protein
MIPQKYTLAETKHCLKESSKQERTGKNTSLLPLYQ